MGGATWGETVAGRGANWILGVYVCMSTVISPLGPEAQAAPTAYPPTTGIAVGAVTPPEGPPGDTLVQICSANSEGKPRDEDPVEAPDGKLYIHRWIDYSATTRCGDPLSMGEGSWVEVSITIGSVEQGPLRFEDSCIGWKTCAAWDGFDCGFFVVGDAPPCTSFKVEGRHLIVMAPPYFRPKSSKGCSENSGQSFAWDCSSDFRS